jgi:predicted metalloprotease with PDZ domain
VRGREVPDYPRLLAAAGIAFEPSRPGAAWIGPLPVGADAEGVRITATPWIGTPLYEAGLDRGDRILAFDGQAATTADDIERILGAHRPGETIAARVLSRGTELEVTLVLEEDPERSGVLASPDRRSADQAATLERWRAASGAVGPGSPG